MFLIIWSRLGILVPVVAIICLFLVSSFFDNIFGAGYYKMHSLPKFIAGIVGGAVIFMIGYWLNSKRDVFEEIIDTQTRKSVLVKRHRHSLFFVPFEYWGVIYFTFLTVAAFTYQPK